jgi:septal ring-binding cell division protein DamX
VSRRLSATQDWLAIEAQGRLTIQVMLTKDDDRRRLEALFRRDEIRPFIDDLYLHETEVAGRKRFSVLYGEFEDRTSAYRALAALPDVLQMYKPYLRSLDVIRAAEITEG